MKGIGALFLGIFGTFAFSWAGLVLIPNYQIGHLDPQMDEDGNDPYPAPKSGMADRGRRIYAANGCAYCHSQQMRADYAGSDLERTRDADPKKPKWGERRSAPRDYLFEHPVLLGKTRLGPDLANIGKAAPAEEENAAPAANPAAPTTPQASPAASPTAAASPGVSPAKAVAATSPAAAAASPAAPTQTSAAASATPASSPGVSPAKAVAATSPAAAAASPAAPTQTSAAASATPASSPGVSPAKAVAATSPATAATSPAAPASPAPSASASSTGTTVAANGSPPPYTAAWHHRHLYSPRSVASDSNMPAYHFLYEKRRISGERAADALTLGEGDAVPEGWEVVPTYEARCLVAYLMSLDQSHALNELKATAAAAPALSPAAASTSPAPAPAKESK
jgi:cbb3-type cytochrome oxidase cytochrome c subunit